ncbi:adenylate/guanylate cyclase domain-containing protein [Opitutus sp. ER46]|uniref:CHASE2 domain-containing protein n=1 Tax=Opitutus sp. ER46 TaxID=2161864 RepID=UPI001304A482|nr:adenylate/guanylate cyclase domain-containing protein [Opitutus sp. ER46]
MSLFQKGKLRSQLHWLLLLPIPLLWCVLHQYGVLDAAENTSVDWRFRYRGELTPPVKVIYVDVDSLSLDAIGNMPWDRVYFARVAAALVNEAKVKAVGFDFVLSEAGMAESADRRKMVIGNVEFGRFLHKQPPVVLAAGYGGWHFIDVHGKRRERALPLIARERRRLEDIDPPELPAFETSPDPDKTRPFSPPFSGLIDTLDQDTRLVPAYAPTATRTYHHMAVELARLYWGLPPGSIKIGDDYLDFVRPDGGRVARVPLKDRQLIEVNWFTRWRSRYTAHVEFVDLYHYAESLVSGTAEEKATAREFFSNPEFKDAVVLVGPVDPLLQDIAPTSLDPNAVPRVGVHGNVLMTIVSGRYLQHVPRVVEHAIIFGLAVVMAAFAVMGGSRAVFAKIAALLVVGAFVAVTFTAFSRVDLVLPLVAPLGAAFSTSFAGLIWQVVAEQKAKSRIKGMFGTYLAPAVVNQMINSKRDPELGGHDAEITAYFSDIQSFSAFSEVLPSSKLGELLNEYLTACTDIVQSEMGTLDKYIGDALVAMFGAPLDAPDHAYRACIASQLVQLRAAELRAKWKSEGDKWPALVHNLRNRIGLNTGVCMIGNMGSRTRFNYTMMGDNVNLAARMESGAKSWGAYTMCTESTRLACLGHNPDRVVFRALGRIVVKGRTQPVPIHEIVGLKENVTDQTRECIALFERALERYYQRDWTGAHGLLEQSGRLEPNQPGRDGGVGTNPSLVYVDIVRHCQVEPPPPDWDGRYVMKEK